MLGVALAAAPADPAWDAGLPGADEALVAAFKGGDKRFWSWVIILGGPVGQLFYWLYGRGPN